MCQIPTARNTHWHLFQTEERNSHETQLLKKYNKGQKALKLRILILANRNIYKLWEQKNLGFCNLVISFLKTKWSNGFEVSQYIHFIFVFDGVSLCIRDLKYTAIFLPQPPRYRDSTNELPWKIWYRILIISFSHSDKDTPPQWNKTLYWTAETRQVSSNTLLSMFTIHWKIRMPQSSALNKVPNHPQEWERRRIHTHGHPWEPWSHVIKGLI